MRQRSGISYWYAVIWNPVSGRRREYRSTGIVDNGTETNRREAEKPLLSLRLQEALKRRSFVTSRTIFGTHQHGNISRPDSRGDKDSISPEQIPNHVSAIKCHVNLYGIATGGPLRGRLLIDAPIDEIDADVLVGLTD